MFALIIPSLVHFYFKATTGVNFGIFVFLTSEIKLTGKTISP